ncbi:MAG: class I SAM-dependent methyltransferase [Candidatus Bathyarchaeota archaeon]
MSSRTRVAIINDHVFHVSKNVYMPAEDSFLIAENMIVEEDELVLDMGVGCGILSILAAEKAKKVIAIDINPLALSCSKDNIKRNAVNDNVDLLCGDLFSPLRNKRRFDLILFNAPYLPSKSFSHDSWISYAWIGGINGRQVIDRFLLEASSYMKNTGRILLVHSTLADVNETFQRLKKNDLVPVIIARKKLAFFEELVVVQANKRSY